mgnify:CR=1 FL=1
MSTLLIVNGTAVTATGAARADVLDHRGHVGERKINLARHHIHPRSGRKGKFVALDLSTVPRELQGAHLFGSVRGAYTGSLGYLNRDGSLDLNILIRTATVRALPERGRELSILAGAGIVADSDPARATDS